ncbi:MAG: hypothetical protein WB661_03110 [Candidatus Bathyarchaeia archaeon]
MNFRSRSSRNARTAVNYFARTITRSTWLGNTATKGLLKMRRNYGEKDEKTLSNEAARTPEELTQGDIPLVDANEGWHQQTGQVRHLSPLIQQIYLSRFRIVLPSQVGSHHMPPFVEYLRCPVPS